jgi:hypothetical protein
MKSSTLALVRGLRPCSRRRSSCCLQSQRVGSMGIWVLTAVYVHPSPKSKDNIPGWFALVEKQGGPSNGSIVTRKSNHPESM